LFVRDSASIALSIPVALRAAGFLLEEGPSRSERSRPRAFFAAAGAFLEVGLEGRLASSSARRASFSAFLRAASVALEAAASLYIC